MTRAVIKKGMIVPLEPLPSDWTEGTEVEVEKVEYISYNGSSPPSNGLNPKDADAWMDEVERLAQQIDPEDDLAFEQAIKEIRQEAKELARRGKL